MASEALHMSTLRNRFSPALFGLLFSLVISVPTLQAVSGWDSLSRTDQRRMALETQLAIEFLQDQHYKRLPFDAISPNELIDNYLEQLDYTRMYFTAEDQNELQERFEFTIKSQYLREGNLFPAFEIFKMYKERVLARVTWVKERLKHDFDLDTDRTFSPDRSEAPFSDNAATLDELWERRLVLEIIEEMLAGDDLATAREKINRRYDRMERTVNEIEAHNVQETFLTTLCHLYDPHSDFFSIEAADEFNIAISNSLVGIGAILRDEDGYCVIQELLPGGPAELSGQLHSGDKIVAVAQESTEPVDVIDMRLRRIVRMIRGDKGTTVALTVIPASDPSNRKVINLIRDEIKLTANLASARIFDVPSAANVTVPIGVIELPSFYGSQDPRDPSTSKDVEELIGKLKSQGVVGIVLDLRRNGGGLLNEAVRLAGLFIPKGPVVMVRDTSGQVRTDWDSDSKLAWDGPLVVLVSRNSASASEIVAGALQVHGRAVIVGDTATHGKGTVQAPWDLSRSMRRYIRPEERLGTIKLTIQKFYLPDGVSTQNEGVKSDIVIPSVNDFLKIGESDLPNALIWDKIEPVSFNPKLITLPSGPVLNESLFTQLKESSASRQAELEEFQYMNGVIERVKERQEQKELSLNLKKRMEQKEQDSEWRERSEEERKRLAAEMPFTQRDIELDLTRAQDAVHQDKLANALLPNGLPRANNFYQKIYYHQEEAGSDIKEIYVENLDYEKALKSSATIAEVLSDSLGLQIEESKLHAFLQYMRSADRGSDIQVELKFAELIGIGTDGNKANTALALLFREMIKLDPRALEENPVLDVHLRESLRVVMDWLQIEASPFRDRLVAYLSSTAQTTPTDPVSTQAQ